MRIAAPHFSSIPPFSPPLSTDAPPVRPHPHWPPPQNDSRKFHSPEADAPTAASLPYFTSVFRIFAFFRWRDLENNPRTHKFGLWIIPTFLRCRSGMLSVPHGMIITMGCISSPSARITIGIISEELSMARCSCRQSVRLSMMQSEV